MRRRKYPTSKVVVFAVLLAVIAFLVWSCYEMHRLDDLTPLAYIGPSVLTLGAMAVGFYNWRAKQSDMVDLEMTRMKTIAKLKEQYGDSLPESILKSMDYLNNE